MSENFGTSVSYVSDPTGYNYDEVIFQKGKPPLDTELNLIQQIQNDLSHRRLENICSGWLSFKDFYCNKSLTNSFYTQNPTGAIPEYAFVNGMPVYVTNTATSETNTNLINLPSGPLTGSQVNGVFLEVWRALLSPTSSDNRPDPIMTVDSLIGIHALNNNIAWAVGENGLILYTENAGQTWNIQPIDTKQILRSVFFVNSSIGWIAGDNGVIGRTSSGGQRWSLLTTGLTTNLNAIHAASQQLAWVVGDNGLILKTLNGINWFILNSGITSNLRSLHFIDTQTGWICGDNGTILRTNDAGVNWVVQNSGVTTRLNSIHFYDMRTGFAVGNEGLILGTNNGGVTWYKCNSGTTQDLTDITMTPSLDEKVVDEDVTSQFTGSNKSCILMHNPVTRGDGNGTVTNLPSDVTVTVNGVKVAVDTVDGTNGIIVLNQAPSRCATVKVTYWYKIDNSIFRGKAWVTGKIGTVLESSDIGTTWILQDSKTGYDLYGISMSSSSTGWAVGKLSEIRYTVDSGITWTKQLSNVTARQTQRVYNEGNVKTTIYLNDNSIHPDLNIETTKRVQVQYRIRIVNDVDPFSYPDAGLGSSAIVGFGPGSSGTDSFINMGSITGDYGLWRAKCNGSVDGYTYAIPMFLVGRRNTSDYSLDILNPSISNSNGSNTSTSTRPDFLTASTIVATDILDVRRKIVVQSTSQLLDDNYEALLNSSLNTRFFRDTLGGDKYGTEVLWTDIINGSTLSNIGYGITSSVSVVSSSYPVLPSASVPSPVTLPFTGTAHQNPAYFSAIYESSSPLYDGKTIPGNFSGYGTSTLTFTFNANANTLTQDPDLISYKLNYTYVTDSTASLTNVPSDPKLVQNYSDSNYNYYNGVFVSSTEGIVISEWNSNISGYNNKAVVYPINSDNSSVMCSPVEIHLYVRADSTNLNTLTINASDFVYSVYTIKQVNNVTAGYSYKLHNISVGSSIVITAENGYNFVSDSVYEVIGMALASKNNVQTGASVHFKQKEKALNTFCLSDMLTKSQVITSGEVNINLSNGSLGIIGSILGVSCTERIPIYGDTGTFLPVCWINAGLGKQMRPIKISSVSGDTLSFVVYEWSGNPYISTSTVTVSVQVLAQQTSLFYKNATTDGLKVSYNYRAYQSVSDLPTSLIVKIVERPKSLTISNLGTGGSTLNKEPFDLPIQDIPVNDPLISSDNTFYNIESLQFQNFSIDGGLVQMPTYVPGNLNGNIILRDPKRDSLGRYFYQTCSKNFVFRTEALQMASPRKIFCGAMAQIVESSDQKLLKNEYVMLVFSRNDFIGTDNYVQYGDKSVIAVYRLPNRPTVRT